MPWLSIITVNLNNAPGLQKTIDSVLRQKYGDFEFLVIDGGSDDGSVEIIKNTEKISYWISEKDKGIYHAMNKGIVKARGEYVTFLNSGDWLYNSDVFADLVNKSDNEDIIYGNVMRVSGEKCRPLIYPDTLSFDFFLTKQNSLPHSCALIKKSLFVRIGLYNESFKIVSDWEFYILAINKHNCSYRHLPVMAVMFNLEGISAQKEFEPVLFKERKIVLEKHFSSFLPDYQRAGKVNAELKRAKKLLGYRIHNKLLKLCGKN